MLRIEFSNSNIEIKINNNAVDYKMTLRCLKFFNFIILFLISFSGLAANLKSDHSLSYFINDMSNRNCLFNKGKKLSLKDCKMEKNKSILEITASNQIKFNKLCLEISQDQLYLATCDRLSEKQKFSIDINHQISHKGKCLTANDSFSLVMGSCISTSFKVQKTNNNVKQISSNDALAYLRLAFASSAAAYQPLDDSFFKGQYIVDGFITNNWTSTRVSIPGRCLIGFEKKGGLCYPIESFVNLNDTECKQNDLESKNKKCKRLQHDKDQSHFEKSDPQINFLTKAPLEYDNVHPVTFHQFETEYNVKACDIGGWKGASFEKEGEKYILLQNENEKISVFSFSGLDALSIEDIITDLQYFPFNLEDKIEDALVNSKLLNSFNKLSHQLKKDLETIAPDTQIILTGHGLGGALATIAAVHFSQWGKKVASVVTFGSPMVGKQKFAKLYQSRVGCQSTVRIVNTEDLIPNILEKEGFQHACGAFEGTQALDYSLEKHDMFLAYKKIVDAMTDNQDATFAATACIAQHAPNRDFRLE